MRLPEITGNIPPDSLLFSENYAQFLRYRQMCDSLRISTKNSKIDNRLVDERFANRFVKSNPEMYLVYRLLGDWHHSRKEYTAAVKYWEIALTKEIPRLSEKEYLEKQITTVSVSAIPY